MQLSNNVFQPVNYLLHLILTTYSPQPQDVTIYTCPQLPVGEEVIPLNGYPMYIDDVIHSPIYFIYVITNTHLTKKRCPLALEVLDSTSRAWQLPRKMFYIIITDNITHADTSPYCCPMFMSEGAAHNTLVIEYQKVVDDSIEYIKDNEIRLYRYASDFEYESGIDQHVQLDAWNITSMQFKWNNNLFPGYENAYLEHFAIDILHTNTSAFDGLDSVNTDSMMVKISKELARYYNYTEQFLEQTIERWDADRMIRPRIHAIIPYARCNLKFVVPMPRINPNINVNYIHMLDWSVWMLIILSFAFGRVAFYIMDSCRMNVKERRISNFDIVSLVLGQTFTKPRVSHVSRIIYTFCLLMLLYFNAMYTGGILRTIVIPSYIKNYKTFQDISDDKNLVYLPTLLALKNGFEGVYFFNELQHITAKVNGLLANDVDYNYFMIAIHYDDKYIDLLRPAKTKYKIFNEEIEDASCSLKLHTFHRYFRDYKFYNMIVSSGLTKKWLQDDYNKPDIFQEIPNHWHPQINEKVILEFHHVKSILFIWLIGIICAAFVFALEFLNSQIEFHIYFTF